MKKAKLYYSSQETYGRIYVGCHFQYHLQNATVVADCHTGPLAPILDPEGVSGIMAIAPDLHTCSGVSYLEKE